jgi:hypothetical protein
MKETLDDIRFLIWFLSYPFTFVGASVLIMGFIKPSWDAISWGGIMFFLGVVCNMSSGWETKISQPPDDLTDEIDRNQ